MSTRTLTIARCPARGQAVMLCGECDSAHTQDRMRDGPIGAMGRWGGAAGGGGGRTPRGPLDATTPALAARSHNDNLYSCIHNTRLGSWCTVIGRLWTRSDVKLKARVKRCVRSRRNSNSMPVGRMRNVSCLGISSAEVSWGGHAVCDSGPRAWGGDARCVEQHQHAIWGVFVSSRRPNEFVWVSQQNGAGRRGDQSSHAVCQGAPTTINRRIYLSIGPYHNQQ
jgi:hypothetical protein